MVKAKKTQKTPAELRLERMRRHIEEAQWELRRTLFGPLLEEVVVEEWSDPLFGCVDAAQGVVYLNPTVRKENELTVPQWTYVLAHQLLHLGLNHVARGRDLDRLPWNLACDCVADRLLRALKIGEPPPGFEADAAFANQREEEIYTWAQANPQALRQFRTLAGSRPDMVSRREAPVVSETRRVRRRDYEPLFAEGIRQAVESAVQDAAEIQGQERVGVGHWPPVEQARRWVMNEMPILGALAAQLRVVADAALCDRMDIAIAAVSASLGEIYFHPGRSLSSAEVLFVYIHELLHVALLHHTRLQGRDPYIWNCACDFVINGWLVEMGVGKFPSVGGLYDPRVQGMGAEEVYDLLLRDPKRCKGLRGFRGKRGDILLDGAGRRLFRGDIATLDDLYRRCMAAGLACQNYGRGLIPAGLLEEIRSLFTPPVPWDVELARWMDAHIPVIRDPLRSYARASRRQSSTPDIPRPARFVPQEWKEACTFGVVLDTSGSMDRGLLGRSLGAIASYAEARDVPAVRLILCDAAPYDKGIVAPTDLRGVYAVQGRGGTVLQPAINYLLSRPDFPPAAPIMIITDGWCEEELIVPREHCFLLPRRRDQERNTVPLRTSAPVFRVLKEPYEP
jgi:predicted metal-dependent peptidase